MRRIATIACCLTFTLTVVAGMTVFNLAAQGAQPFEESITSLPVVSTFPSELTVEGLVSLSRGDYSIQMGAFTRQSNAEYLRNKLAEMIGIDVDVVSESGLYKVYINSDLIGKAPCLFIPVSFSETVPVAVKPEEAAFGQPDSVKVVQPEVVTADTLSQVQAPEPASPDTTAAVMIMPAETVIEEPVVQQEQPAKFSLNKLLSLSGESPWLSSYNYFGKSVTLVNLLIITILVSFITMLILLVVILLNRRNMEKEARLRQFLLEKYQALIIDYLFGNTTADAFRPIASDTYRRQVLVDQMIDVSVNLKGESGEKLYKLYRELELDRDSMQRAHSRKWHKRIKGFRELAFMGIRDANDEMYRSLNSRNEILRMEAQIALVRLSEKDPFEFLSHLERPFSLWEQITLHDLIIQHEIPVPEFRKWLGSANPTVVMFALRMIREFKQRDAEAEVKVALLHRNPGVSQLAVQVAGDLEMRNTLETMKRMYKFQDYNNCLEIVKSVGKMPDLSMMGFLKLVLDKEDDVQLQIEAVKGIENMGEEGVKALVKVMKSEYKNYNIIVRHVLDRRIY